MTGSNTAISATFHAVEESLPGAQWQALQQRLWPQYKTWFLAEGDAVRPSYLECRRALKRYMPELMPTYERLCDLAGGGDTISRFLSLYCPPPYLSGCTQAVWTGDQPVLVRNYDYSAQRLEGVLLKTCWNGRDVIAMSDALWGALDGINQSGLAVSLAFGGRLESGEGFGIPLILRYILEFCETSEQAIDVLQRVPSHMSYNVTLVDPTQRFATVYVAPDRLPVVRQVPVATNHQKKVEWARHAWATATLERESAVQSILADTEETVDGLIGGFLQPPIFNSAYRRGFGTLYTAVYWPVSRQASYLWPAHRWDVDMHHFNAGTYHIEYSKG